MPKKFVHMSLYWFYLVGNMKNFHGSVQVFNTLFLSKPKEINAVETKTVFFLKASLHNTT